MTTPGCRRSSSRSESGGAPGARSFRPRATRSPRIPEKFAGVPAGGRAIQVWDSEVPHDFLRMFGRPVRVTTCTCERNAEPSVGQVLHLLNAPGLHANLTHEGGTVARLVRRLAD